MRTGTLGASLALLLMACLFAMAAFPHDAAAVSIEIAESQLNYAPGRALNGSVRIAFESKLPDNSQLRASIDGGTPSVIDVSPFLSGTNPQYKQYAFTFNITASGRSQWYEYPDKSFWYRIRASGTCGSEVCATMGSCDCAGLCTPPSSPPYYCSWSIVYPTDMQSSVNAVDGLKRIVDGQDLIAPPWDANPDTAWLQIIDTTQYAVQTSMRMACGGSDYQGQATDSNGWVKRSLPYSGFITIPGTTKKRITIEPFDHTSLAANRQQFLDSNCSLPYTCGGIYEGTKYLSSGFSANGSSGEITIDSYNLSASYVIVYLPPKGSVLCAYTAAKVARSESWTARSLPQAGTVSYDRPFSKTYSDAQLPYAFSEASLITALVKPPPCPYFASECSQSVSSYSAVKGSDPAGGSISVFFNGQSRTFTATVSLQEYSSSYTTRWIGLGNFTTIRTPSQPGEHSLLISLFSGSSELAWSEALFAVCEDPDGDGFCAQNGDCNNSNDKVSPGAAELCNGVDDDCDGKIDEDFWAAGSKLGEECGLGICAGKYYCSADGRNVVCSGKAPVLEVCGNGLDDDCDGQTDEIYELDAAGLAKPACFCGDGERKACGSNIGACVPGYQACVKGQWTRCLDAQGPFEEACNGVDDDCNGVVDDVDGGDSIASSACGCYKGAQPSAESCNSIDDDCNGLEDDGISCCEQGQTRPCGTDRGICRPGTQSCNNGYWEAGCRGAEGPNPGGEVCHNGLDDDCDGQADENCESEFTCTNGQQDLNENGVDCGGDCPQDCAISLNWLLFAGGAILLILVFVVMALRGRA